MTNSDQLNTDLFSGAGGTNPEHTTEMKFILLQMKSEGRLALLPRHLSQARVLLLFTAWKEVLHYSSSLQDIPAPLQDPNGPLV